MPRERSLRLLHIDILYPWRRLRLPGLSDRQAHQEFGATRFNLFVLCGIYLIVRWGTQVILLRHVSEADARGFVFSIPATQADS